MKVLILDNYDSFTYNLAHYVEAFGVGCTVLRNDVIQTSDIDEHDKLIISPGPGLPKDSGRMMECIAHAVNRTPMLGICLGLQGIAMHFGGDIFRMQQVAHGLPLKCKVLDRGSNFFDGIPDDFEAGMYHSWAVDPANVPDEMLITAMGENEVIMGMRHRSLDIQGVQFHPESIMTPEGKKMIGNWLEG